MRLFGSERVARVIDALGIDEDDPIEHKMLTKAIENAQKKVEGNNFAVRKRLLEYDQVMNEQREIIYAERRKVLFGEDLKESILAMCKDVIQRTVDKYAHDGEFPEEWNISGINETLCPMLNVKPIELTDTDKENLKKEELVERIFNDAKEVYQKKEEEVQPERMRELERVILLKMIDQKWMNHIDDMDQMRQGISLRAYAQRDPIVEYKFVSFDMFDELTANIQEDTVKGLFNIRVVQDPPEREQVVKVMFTNRDDSAGKKPVKRQESKIGRNEPCPCGSGKKYKQCCGANN